jgi:predicted deacylase
VNENLNRQANTTTQKTSGQRYSYSLWNDLLKDNADYAIDMHTANPTTFPLFAYANLSIEKVRRMVTLFGPDVSFNSHSSTTVAGAFNEIDVPAFTLEIGAREAYEPALVSRAVSGAVNFLTYTGVLPGEFIEYHSIRETNEWVEIYAENGGFVVPQVEMLSDVDVGETLFVQYDAFGHIVREYESPVAGILVQVIQTPMAEAGTQLGAVVYFNPEKKTDDNLGAGSITIKPEFADKKIPIRR